MNKYKVYSELYTNTSEYTSLVFLQGVSGLRCFHKYLTIRLAYGMNVITIT